MKILVDIGKLVAMGIVEIVQDDMPDPESVPDNNQKKEQQKVPAIELLDFLNRKAGRDYQPVSANITMIKARLKEYGKAKLQMMIAKKVGEWKGTDMEKYLRPATLFNATKCAQYVGELVDSENQE